MNQNANLLRLLGRTLYRQSSLKKHFFRKENEPFRTFWWYGADDDLLFVTYGNTACPWKSAWLTSKYMNRIRLSDARDMEEITYYCGHLKELTVRQSEVREWNRD